MLRNTWKKLEETLASERLIHRKNIEQIDELKVKVKKADERTKTFNKTVNEKDAELVKCKDLLNKDICENEKKIKEMEGIKLVLVRKEK